MNMTNSLEEVHPDYVIVGAGISGLLLALKLSKDPAKVAKGITIIEKEAQLGGRYFFSQQNNFNGKNNEQVLNEIQENSFKNLFLSGPGFEFLDANSLEVLYRHFQAQLTESEKNELEEFYSKFNSEIQDEYKDRNIIFVKKEFIPVSELLNTSTEFFTKKEAEIFKNLIDSSITNNYPEVEQHISFEKSKFWTDLTKSTRETLTPFLQTILGPNWEKSQFSNIVKGLNDFFTHFRKKVPNLFYRNVGFEYFIGSILRRRGVEIRNLCELSRVHVAGEKKFQLMLADELLPQRKFLVCKQLIFAMPLNECLGIIAKEHFSPNQSRFLSKVRPISLVISELINFSAIQGENWPKYLEAQDCLVFPVERVTGFLTQDNRLIMTTKLDYEDSLQAPAVREAVARLRKALARVIQADFIPELKKGARIPQKKIAERIILLPVALTLPNDIPPHIEVKETKMGVDGMYCCGDNFPGMADQPWKMIVNSVNDICLSIS